MRRLRRVLRVAQRNCDGYAAWPNPGRLRAARAAEIRLATGAAARAFHHRAPSRGCARILREHRMGSLRTRPTRRIAYGAYRIACIELQREQLRRACRN